MEAPLPDRKHFKHVFVPNVNFPLFITRASLVLMPSWDFFDCENTHACRQIMLRSFCHHFQSPYSMPVSGTKRCIWYIPLQSF